MIFLIIYLTKNISLQDCDIIATRNFSITFYMRYSFWCCSNEKHFVCLRCRVSK